MFTQRACIGQALFAFTIAMAGCSADEITSSAECVADLAEEGERKSGEASANCYVDTNEPDAGGAGGAGGGDVAPEEPEHHTLVDSRCAGHVDFEVCKYSPEIKYALCYEGECLPYGNAGANSGHGGCATTDDCPDFPCREEVCHKGLCVGFWPPELEGKNCIQGEDATCHLGSCIVGSGQ